MYPEAAQDMDDAYIALQTRHLVIVQAFPGCATPTQAAG